MWGLFLCLFVIGAVFDVALLRAIGGIGFVAILYVIGARKSERTNNRHPPGQW